MIVSLRTKFNATTISAATVRFLIVGLLLAGGLGVRLLHMNEAPLDFHATRQYRSLLIARAFFLDTTQGEPEWRRQVAAINLERQGTLEPPLMELLVSRAYYVLGGEQLWVPKLISTIFWLAGGLFLYRIGLRVGDGNAAVLATAFYLFLPFGVIASRSFQPDPLMVMLLLASVLLCLRYYERPSSAGLLMAAAVSAAALFVKPVSLFVIAGVFIALGIDRLGFRRFLRSRDTITYFGLSAFPTIAFYAYGVLALGTLHSQAEASFVPQILITPFFWKGWLKNIGDVVGFSAFVGALLGVIMIKRGTARILLMGLWAGYALFCLVFSYHIASHDYYHLQLVPIVALSLIPVAEALMDRLALVRGHRANYIAPVGLLALMLALAVGLLLSRSVDPLAQQSVVAAEEIGRLVHHSTAALVLSPDYGLPLEYHGELSVMPWPISSDLEWERLAGIPSPSAEERFENLMARTRPPEYFIVLNSAELEAQADLKSFLTEHYSVLAQNADYIIFDLQQKIR